ncbi:hypothetical protein [Streptomyces sp. NPDC051219]|uniref:hypothetical protein n=1 Tax=Streptomyces sp. NPDC051219 TaxID=3155283 RepID=UPI0034318BAB
MQLRHTALTATLGLAAPSWVVAAWQMNGMDMGVATGLGSFAFFVPLWASMMAARCHRGAGHAEVLSPKEDRKEKDNDRPQGWDT